MSAVLYNEAVFDPARLTTFGSGLRAIRLSLGLGQRELARRAGRSQAQVSMVERGQAPSLTVADADRLCRAVGATLVFGVEAPLLLGAGRQTGLVHARCVAHVARRLLRAGWLVEREVEIGEHRRPGWIDVLACHPARRVLLVVEVKTELDDLGELERQVGWYEREAVRAATRFGWRVDVAVGCVLLLATEANDDRIRAVGTALALAYPGRARELAAIVEGQTRPSGPSRALAMIDPLSRARRWCRPTVLEGRRTAAPYRHYADAARAMGGRSRVRHGRGGSCAGHGDNRH